MFDKNQSELIVVPEKSNLFDKVVSILEQARLNVVKSVNSNMIIAYWLIGRAIVYEIQGGEERAEYGKRVVTELSKQLNKKYKKGFSTTNLWYFRQFYLAYSTRQPLILHKPCGELLYEEKFYDESHHILSDMSMAVEKSRKRGQYWGVKFKPIYGFIFHTIFIPSRGVGKRAVKYRY